jgi:TPP-dependent pyruvate/acetoin dehydrogenase alpha subunit
MSSDPLTRVRELTAARAATQEEWRATIRAALRAGVHAQDIAEAAGVSSARIYQIGRGDR